MSAFILKLVAIITMFIDHSGDVLLPELRFMRVIGRIAFPIFAFLIANGFIHTKSIKKYLLRLGIFAVIAQPIYNKVLLRLDFFEKPFAYNILFNLFIGIVMLWVFKWICDRKLVVNERYTEKEKDFYYYVLRGFIIIAALLSVIPFAFISEEMPTGYGWYGIVTILICYLFYKKKWALAVAFILLNIAQNVPIYIEHHVWYIQFWSILSLPFICLYNYKPGPKAKYLFYVFYPAHLALIGMVAYLLK